MTNSGGTVIGFYHSGSTLVIIFIGTSSMACVRELFLYRRDHSQVTFFINVTPVLVVSFGRRIGLSLLRLYFLGARGVYIGVFGGILGTLYGANAGSICVPQGRFFRGLLPCARGKTDVTYSRVTGLLVVLLQGVHPYLRRERNVPGPQMRLPVLYLRRHHCQSHQFRSHGRVHGRHVRVSCCRVSYSGSIIWSIDY